MGSMDYFESEHTNEGDLNDDKGTACTVLNLKGSRRSELAWTRSVDEAVKTTA